MATPRGNPFLALYCTPVIDVRIIRGLIHLTKITHANRRWAVWSSHSKLNWAKWLFWLSRKNQITIIHIKSYRGNKVTDYYYYKCQDLSDSSQPLRGHFTKSTNKNVTRLLSQWQCTISQQETVPDFCQPNDWRKRWDLVSRWNDSIEDAALVCGGRLFHARAAATGNAQSPRVDRRVDSTSKQACLPQSETTGKFGTNQKSMPAACQKRKNNVLTNHAGWCGRQTL